MLFSKKCYEVSSSPVFAKKFNDARQEQHPFHIVDNSIVPFIVAAGAFILTSSIALFFNEYLHYKAARAVLMAFFLLVVEWCVLVSKEGINGFHTKAVLRGLKLGFILFIVSEVMFFFSFFWAFFHFALAPSI